MTFYDARDPYGGAIQEQAAALAACREFVQTPCESPTNDAAVAQTSWHIGSLLQPATEGLARIHPEYVRLDSHMHEGGETGIGAYETWMSTGPAFKEAHAFTFRPSTPKGETATYELSLGAYAWDEVCIRQREAMNPAFVHLAALLPFAGIISLRNTYTSDDNELARRAARRTFTEELPNINAHGDVLTYGLTTPLSPADEALLAREVERRFDEEASATLATHGKEALLQHRLWFSLKAIFERLPEV